MKDESDIALENASITITIRGRVETLYHSSPTFSAGRMRSSSGEPIRFAGQVFARENDLVMLRGHWENNAKFGRQFKVLSMQYDLTLDAQGLERYLADNPNIKGIGPAKAKRIVARFGDRFEQALLETPDEMAKVAKAPRSTIEKLREIWLAAKNHNEVIAWLASFELTHHQIEALMNKLGNNVVAILRDDPYLICQHVPGFGFKRIDAIARKTGMLKDAPARIRAGIQYALETALDNGHCWLEYHELIKRSNDLLLLDTLDSKERIEGELEGLFDRKELATYDHDEHLLVAFPRIKTMEEDLARVFRLGQQKNPHLDKIGDPDSWIAKIAPDLNEGQQLAVKTVLRHGISLISGGAGSGKTYTISAIARIYEKLHCKVMLAAPTGKAAKRIEQVVGLDAFTIHRMLGYRGKEFALGPDNPVKADVLIVDEMSMANLPLTWQLFRSIDRKKTAVVLVGDHNQLPPVGPGNPLRNLIHNRTVPTVILDKVVRQAGVLKDNSTAILAGTVRPTSGELGKERKPWTIVDQFTHPEHVHQFILDLFEQVLDDKLHYDLTHDVQVLTPTHKGPLGTLALNASLQRLIQRKLYGVHLPVLGPDERPRPRLHDKVIQLKNDYTLDIMNGAGGVVTKVAENGTLTIDFDGNIVEIAPKSTKWNHIQLAYALSIHRSQGSEFPCAVVLMHKSHAFMHHRNLFYTAVTRAKESVLIIGDRWGIQNCARKHYTETRKTALSFLLQGRSIAAEP